MKIAASIFGIVFLLVMLIIAIFFPHPSKFQLLVFRITLALAAAGVTAMIPGFIKVDIPKYVKAGGPIAVFVMIYWFISY